MKAQPMSKTAAAIFIVNQEDIRRSGATSIPEVLRMVPGLNVAKVDGNKWAISARGFNDRYSSKMLVLMDGRTLYTPFFAGVYWELQDYALEDIERIEVIRGPGGSLWGVNAVNGIINIITKKSKDTQGVLASTVVGTEEVIGTARYGGNIGEDFHYRLYVKGFNRDTSYSSEGAHDDWRAGRGGVRADWNLSPRDTVTFHGNYSDGRMGERSSNPQLSFPFGSRIRAQDVTLSSHSLLTNWSHRFAGGSESTLRMYYDQYHRDSSSIGERITTYDIDFQHHVPLPFGNDVVWGVGYRLMRDRFRTSPVLTMSDTARDLNRYSGFIQDEITLLPDRLFLTVGSKFLHNEFTHFEVQPSARLLWAVTPQHSLWASISRAVRTPDRFREDARLNVAGTPFGPISIVGNTRLYSERVIAYEGGYRGQVHSSLTLDIVGFYDTYDRLIYSQSLGGFPPTSQYANNATGHTTGVEVAAEWRPLSWWTLRPAFTYQHVMVMAGPLVNIDMEGHTPRHHTSLQSRMTWKDWEFDAWYRHVDRINDLSVPGYHTLDLRFGWHITPQWDLDLVGQNLLDPHHLEFSGRNGGTYATEVQRAGYLRLTWRY
ncbi:MAG: TonB-dependent receptor [Nitrospira sp.]|nr:TonB-dependent receptor [Nitrospira sp.]